MNITTAASLQNIYAPVRNSASDRAKTNTENIFAPLAAAKSAVKPANRLETEEYTAKQKREFSDMYVTSSAHKYFSKNRSKAAASFDLLKLCVEISGRASKESCIPVPIEVGELPAFMDRVQDSMKNGMFLEEIIKQKYDEHISKYGEEGHTNSYADWFAINTSTGDVMSAGPISRTYHGDSFDEELADMEAVMELADDLSCFLRYAVFSKETDDPEKVGELFSFIKNKQADANYDRFLAAGEENGTNADVIAERLFAAGVLKDDENKEKEEAVDGLMEAVRIHCEMLRDKKINMEKREKTIAEIQEMINKDINE